MNCQARFKSNEANELQTRLARETLELDELKLKHGQADKRFQQKQRVIASLKNLIAAKEELAKAEGKSAKSKSSNAVNFVKLARSYGNLSIQAEKHFAANQIDDGLRVLSNLIETNPGNIVASRDVAFTALKWERPTAAYHLLRRVSRLRPYEGHVYTALAECLRQMGKTELAIIFYEVAVNGDFAQRNADFRKIATFEYLHLLREINEGRLMTAMEDYALARKKTLLKNAVVKEADLVVTMMWNTDRTDVDLHVVEPSGEECYYKNSSTKAGGKITADITDGFGPEMYYIKKSKPGKFIIKANNYASDRNRTKVQSKLFFTIYENFGTPREKRTRKTVAVSHEKEMVRVHEVVIGND